MVAAARHNARWLSAWYAVALSIGAPLACSAASEPCNGHDLLSEMATASPADWAQLQRAARDMPFHEGRLFRLARPGLPASFLFATVHLADPRVAALSPWVKDALIHARTVAVESVDEHGRAAATQTKRAIAAPDGLRASQLLGSADLRRLEQLLTSRGFAPALAFRYKSVALALILDIPGCAAAHNQPGAFLDALVLDTARAGGVATVGLETLAEQVDIADDLTAAEQTALLHSVLAQSTRAEDSVETTVGLYRRGEIGLLLAWTSAIRPIPGVSDAGTPKPVLDRLVTARTRRMFDRLLPLLDQGGVFVAVGATHIPGPDGLGVLLERAGYAVEKVE